MRYRIITAAACLLAAATTTAAPSPAPQALKASGPWNVEFADSMCLLGRPFGKGGETNIIFKPSMIGDGFELIISQARSSVAPVRYGKVVLRVAGKPVEFDGRYTAYSSKTARLIRIIIDDETLALSAIHDTLEIDAVGEKRFAFSISGMAPALPVLAGCTADLRTAYKVSEADVGVLATKPTGTVAKIFSSDDYPREAWAKNEIGTVGVLLWIEANGRVSTCQVIETNASAALQQKTCEIFRDRARMTPATNAANQAVRAPMFSRVSWQLPD